MFSDDDRKIFSYDDGGRAVKADPLALRRRLTQAAGGKLAELCAAACPPAAPVAPPEPEPGGTTGGGPPKIIHDSEDVLLGRLEAEENLLKVIRHAFELQPFDKATGEGCTEAMVWAVWDRWGEWLEKNGPRGGS